MVRTFQYNHVVRPMRWKTNSKRAEVASGLPAEPLEPGDCAVLRRVQSELARAEWDTLLFFYGVVFWR